MRILRSMSDLPFVGLLQVSIVRLFLVAEGLITGPDETKTWQYGCRVISSPAHPTLVYMAVL